MIDNTFMLGGRELTETDILPKQYFCGGATVKQGLTVLAVVAFLDTIMLLILASRPLNKQDESDKKVDGR